MFDILGFADCQSKVVSLYALYFGNPRICPFNSLLGKKCVDVYDASTAREYYLFCATDHHHRAWNICVCCTYAESADIRRAGAWKWGGSRLRWFGGRRDGREVVDMSTEAFDRLITPLISSHGLAVGLIEKHVTSKNSSRRGNAKQIKRQCRLSARLGCKTDCGQVD